MCDSRIKEAFFRSPISDIKIEYCAHGLHSFNFQHVPNVENFKPDPKAGVELLSNECSTDHVVIVILNWITTYFADASKICSVQEPKLCLPDSGELLHI